MKKEFNLSIFIFRRDLRINDNTALFHALRRSEMVIPCFIVDTNLVERKNRNEHAIQFMIESLEDLEKQFLDLSSLLYFFIGKPEEVVSMILSELQIDAVFVNEDYTPYSKQRDKKLSQVAQEHNSKFYKYSDSMLVAPFSVYTGSGSRYKVFTYFYKAVKDIDIKPIQNINFKNFYLSEIKVNKSLSSIKSTYNFQKTLSSKGGRAISLNILQNIQTKSDYEDERNFPGITHGTTQLSPYIKFGTLSIREVYYWFKENLGINHPLIRQLYWREFYYYLAIHFDHIFDKPFKLKYNRIKWDNDRSKFDKWCKGLTGFPIVDAGMRELNSTGTMHNRVRMIVASFLVKDLHINWQWGEKYFKEKLIDYDVMVNNGNWQWVASTGADAQPYFRIFNPWSQQKKFDPNGDYIRKFIPELSELDNKALRKLETQRPRLPIDYPEPIVIHKKQSVIAKSLFQSVNA